MTNAHLKSDPRSNIDFLKVFFNNDFRYNYKIHIIYDIIVKYITFLWKKPGRSPG